MEVRCKEKCQCSKNCKSCSGFEKVLDLEDAGLVIYRYTKCLDKIDKTSGNMKSSVNTTNDVFIIHNTKDIRIMSDECVTKIDDEVSCPRCRELVQRAQKYLKNIPSIDKKDVISVCDHCQNKKQSIKYGCECYDVVQKFLSEKDKQSVEKEQIKTWFAKIQKLLSKNVFHEMKRLKCRAYSELNINKLYKDDLSTTRELVVEPMLEVGVKIPESTRLIDKVATKSESALKYLDSKKTKFKPDLFESYSSIHIERNVSSSLAIYDMSLDKEPDIIKGDLELDAFERLRHKELVPKSAIKHREPTLPKLIKKYYSDEKIFVSDAKFENLENLKINFSYVFPKEESEIIKPLRKVKTSVELIEDAQDKLRLRAKLINNEISTQLVKRSIKRKQMSLKKSDEQDINIKGSQEVGKKTREDLVELSNQNTIIDDQQIKSDKDKILEEKKEKLSSKNAKTEDKEIKINKDKVQKYKKETPLSKKTITEDKEINGDRDKIRKVIKERPSSKKAGTKRDKDKNQKEKTMSPKIIDVTKGKTDQKKVPLLSRHIDEKQKGKNEELQKEKEEKDTEKKEQKGIEKKEQKSTEKMQLQQKKEKKEIVQGKKEKKENERREVLQSDKEKTEEYKKDKDNKEEFQEGKEKKEKFLKDNKKTEEVQNEKERKEKEKEFQQKLKDKQKRSKDEKIKNKDKETEKGADNAAANFKKNMDEQAKLKAEALAMKKQEEEENKKMRMEAEKNTKEAEPKLKGIKEANVEKKPDIEKPTPETIQEEPTIKELSIKQIKIRNPSTDDLILRLVRLKQASKKPERPNRLSQINITPVMVKEHKIHKARKILNCAICVDSELELDVENIIIDENEPDEVTDLIVGNKIIKSKHPISVKSSAQEMFPVLYKALYTEDIAPKQQIHISEKMSDRNDLTSPGILAHKYAEQELPKGIIRYALSDRSFIDKGWTMLPTEKVVRKMNVYRMRPAHPEFDWFDRNKNKRLMLYDTGEKLAEFDDNGRGRWFYRNGRLALDYYDAEEINAQQRFVIYGSGESDERGRYQPISILATFDYLGNGVVFDHTGKIRLKYNQTEGVVLDRAIGPVSHWKWHTLNDPPVLQQVMIDTQMSHKDPEIMKLGGPADDKVRPDNEEMLAIEFDNFIKEKSKKMSQKFKPFQIRTKALKINEHFSLKVLDQANIYLIFRDGTTNIKLNIGMILDHQEIVDTDIAEVGEVSNNLERFPARTDSLAGLQRSVAYAQRVERLRVEREHRLKHPEAALSADRLVAAASRPLRSQLKIVPSSSTAANDKCFCKCRKPSSSNIYYDTRLI